MTLAVKPLNLYIAAVSTTSSASESESGCCTSSDEEVWALFDSEDEEEPGEDIDGSLNQTISAVSFFLLFYQLTYHLSERAVNALIGFLRTIFQFFSVVTGHAVLVELVHTFPDYLQRIVLSLNMLCVQNGIPFIKSMNAFSVMVNQSVVLL